LQQATSTVTATTLSRKNTSRHYRFYLESFIK